MRNNRFALGFCAFFFFLSSCIQTQSREVLEIERKKVEGPLQVSDVTGAKVEYLVYRQSLYPLEDFFTSLRRGEFKESLSRARLSYRPSNTNNRALEELIDAGFTPVYVRVTNETAAELPLDEKSFSLVNEKSLVKAFYSDQLPGEFKRFNPSAAAANVYNTGVVIVGIAALLGIVVILRGPVLPGSGGDPSKPATLGDTNPIWNDLEQSRQIRYQDFLIQKKALKPGEVTEGLLFFYGAKDLEAKPAVLRFQSGFSSR